MSRRRVPARHVHAGGRWYVTRWIDAEALTIGLEPAGPPPASEPLPAPKERVMTFDTITALAKTLSPAVAGDALPLIAAGLRMKYPAAKPTMEADLQTEFTALQATYAAVANAEASTKALLADLK